LLLIKAYVFGSPCILVKFFNSQCFIFLVITSRPIYINDHNGASNCSLEFVLYFDDNVAVNGRPNVNVALNRPAFMPTILDDPNLGGQLGPWKAVDGNKDPVLSQMDNSCIHTHAMLYPWWAVDLSSSLKVVGVLFTNRADGWGNLSIKNSNKYLIYVQHCVSMCRKCH